MVETSWSMAFSGMAEDTKENREAFEELFNVAMAKARAIGTETMNCNGQFYSRGEVGTVTVTEASYDAHRSKPTPAATPSTLGLKK